MERPEFLNEFYRITGIMAQFGDNPLFTRTRTNPDRSITLLQPYILLRGLFDMAGKKKTANRSPFGNIQFVSYKMDAVTLAAFNEWFTAKGNTVVGGIFETLQAENKMSLSWDDEHECFIGAMTGKDDSLNKGKCLTIRSKEWFKALAACAYVHTVVFDGEIWDVSSETDMV